MTEEVKYYNIWRIPAERWTNADSPIFGFQHTSYPHLLTKEEAQGWLATDFLSTRGEYEVREIDDETVKLSMMYNRARLANKQELVEQRRKAQEYREDQARRLAHAMKYL